MTRLLALVLTLAAIVSADAADNTVIVTPGTGVTLRSKDVGSGVESMIQIPGDTSGNALATVPGTPNAVFALPVQGVTGGTAVPISGAITITSGTTAITAGASAFASGAALSGSWADGAIVTLGTEADAAWASGSGTVVSILKNIAGGVAGSVPACAASPCVTVIGGVVPYIGATAMDATHGWYTNLLQGNAVIATGNPLFMTGTGTAGSAATNPITVQGIASMTPILANPGTAANWGVVAVAAAPPANAIYEGVLGSGATGGHVAAPIICDGHKFVHITSATDTLLVQGVASQTIRGCGWRSRAAGVATWYIEDEADANANCSNLGAQLTGIATEAANTGETMLASFWTGFAGASGHGLCIKSTGTGGVDIDFFYSQF